jgi:hypothetical protein
VEGSIRHPNTEEAWEYAVTVTITNDRGVELTRQIVGVGAIKPGEQRKFTVAVEVFTPAGPPEPDVTRPSLADAKTGQTTPPVRR